MNIEKKILGEHAILKVEGRLDAAWAEHLRSAVQETVRDGHHHLRLDVAGLEYLSSAGIRCLLRTQREISAVKGSFGIINPSPFVAQTLKLSGLQQLILSEGEPAGAEPSPKSQARPATSRQPVPGMRFDVHSLVSNGRIRARIHSGWKPWNQVQECDSSEASFPKDVFGLGIGAPGSDFVTARDRFGEFVAASGHLVWLPGDGSDTPDYLEQAGQFIPRLRTIQSIRGEGSFSHLLRFSPDEKGNFLNMSDLSAHVLDTTGSDSAAMVGIVEVEGLVGASLSRSPGLIGKDDRPSEFPEIRDWLRFCGERLHRQSQALIVTFISRDPAHSGILQLTPLPSAPEIRHHSHAAVLPYRPLQQGILEIEPSVAAVFEDSEPLALLHLVEDDRPVVGLGQSSFIRGACWCAPLDFIKEPNP